MGRTPPDSWPFLLTLGLSTRGWGSHRMDPLLPPATSGPSRGPWGCVQVGGVDRQDPPRHAPLPADTRACTRGQDPPPKTPGPSCNSRAVHAWVGSVGRTPAPIPALPRGPLGLQTTPRAWPLPFGPFPSGASPASRGGPGFAEGQQLSDPPRLGR